MTSRRKKKVEAALDDLFSAVPKPAESVLPSENSRVDASGANLVDKLLLPDTFAPATDESETGDILPDVEMNVMRGEMPPAVHSADQFPKRDSRIEPTIPPATTSATTLQAINQEDQTVQLVVFLLDGNYYGVDINIVEGIIKMQAITVVPNTASFIEGVTNLRGNILPVVNLRRRFGLEAASNLEDCQIVIVNLSDTHVGIIVDMVSEVLQVPLLAIETTPAMMSGIDTAYLSGVAKIDSIDGEIQNTVNRLVLLLNLEIVIPRHTNVVA